MALYTVTLFRPLRSSNLSDFFSYTMYNAKELNQVTLNLNNNRKAGSANNFTAYFMQFTDNLLHIAYYLFVPYNYSFSLD